MEEQSSFDRMSLAVINAHKAMKILQTENEQLKQQNENLKSELKDVKLRLNEASALSAKQLKSHTLPQASTSSKKQKLNNTEAALQETRRSAVQSFCSATMLKVPSHQKSAAVSNFAPDQLPYEMITEPFEFPEKDGGSGAVESSTSAATKPAVNNDPKPSSNTASTTQIRLLASAGDRSVHLSSKLSTKPESSVPALATINYDLQKGREALPPSTSKRKSGPERALSLLKYLDNGCIFSVAIALTKLTPQSVTKTFLQTLGRYARLNLKHIWSYDMAKRSFTVYQQEIELFVKLLQALFDSECKNGLETFNIIITGLHSALISRLKFRCGNAIEHLHFGQSQSMHARLQSMIAATLIELRIGTNNQHAHKKQEDSAMDEEEGSSLGEDIDSDNDEAEETGGMKATATATKDKEEDDTEVIETEQFEEELPSNDNQTQPQEVDQSRQEELRKLFNMDTMGIDDSDSDNNAPPVPPQKQQSKLNKLDITEVEIEAATQTVYDRLEVITADDVLCLEHCHDFILLYLTLRMMMELVLEDMLLVVARDLEVALFENVHAVSGAVYALMIIHNQYPHVTCITSLLGKWTVEARKFIADSEDGIDKTQWTEMESQVHSFCVEQMQTAVNHPDFQHLPTTTANTLHYQATSNERGSIWSIMKRIITTELSTVTCALFGLDEYTVHICHLMHDSHTSEGDVMSMEEMLRLPLTTSSSSGDAKNNSSGIALIQSRQQWWQEHTTTLDLDSRDRLNHDMIVFFGHVLSPILACYDVYNMGWRLHEKTVIGVPLQAIFTTRTQVIHDLYENYRRQSVDGMAMLPPFPRTEKGDVKDLAYTEFVSADGDSLKNATRALDFIQVFISKTWQQKTQSNENVGVLLDKIKQQAHELRLLFAFLMLERLLQMWLSSLRGFLHFLLSLSSEASEQHQQQQFEGLLRSTWQFTQIIPKCMSYKCRGELAYELKQCLTTRIASSASDAWRQEALLKVVTSINYSLPCFFIHPTASEPHCLKYHRRFLIRASKAGLLSITVDLGQLQAHEVSRSDVTTTWNSTLHSKMDRKVVARKDMQSEAEDVLHAAYHIHIWRQIAAVYTVKQQRNAAIKSLFHHSSSASSASEKNTAKMSDVVKEVYLQSNFIWSNDDTSDDSDFYLIFQPDGMPKNSDLTQFRPEILKLVKNLPAGWDICFIGGLIPTKGPAGSGSLFREVSYQPRHTYSKINYLIDNAGYIIKGHTARKLLEQLPVTGPVGAFLSSLLFHDELHGYLIQLCASERHSQVIFTKSRSSKGKQFIVI